MVYINLNSVYKQKGEIENRNMPSNPKSINGENRRRKRKLAKWETGSRAQGYVGD